jgi:hypothetical protein
MSQQLAFSGHPRKLAGYVFVVALVLTALVGSILWRPSAAHAAGSADLSVRQAFSGSSTSGRTVDTVTIHNAGPDAAANINYSKFLATTSSTVTVTSNAGVCEFMPPPSNAWKLFDACQVGSLAAGATLVITVTWGGTPGLAFTSTVTVGSSIVDPTTSNNISTASSWYGPRADLHLSQAGSIGSTAGKAKFVHTITNRGPNTANALQLIIEIKSSGGLSVGYTATPLSSCQTIPPATGFQHAVACTTNSLATGAKWVLTGTYTGPAGTAVSAKTTVSANNPADPVPADNSGTAATTFHA